MLSMLPVLVLPLLPLVEEPVLPLVPYELPVPLVLLVPLLVPLLLLSLLVALWSWDDVIPSSFVAVPFVLAQLHSAMHRIERAMRGVRFMVSVLLLSRSRHFKSRT